MKTLRQHRPERHSAKWLQDEIFHVLEPIVSTCLEALALWASVIDLLKCELQIQDEILRKPSKRLCIMDDLSRITYPYSGTLNTAV